MSIKPLNNNIFVRTLDTQESTIALISANPEAPKMGEIVFAPAGLPVSTGDKIMFGRWAGKPVEHEGEDLLVMTDMDILVVLDWV